MGEKRRHEQRLGGVNLCPRVSQTILFQQSIPTLFPLQYTLSTIRWLVGTQKPNWKPVQRPFFLLKEKEPNIKSKQKSNSYCSSSHHQLLPGPCNNLLSSLCCSTALIDFPHKSHYFVAVHGIQSRALYTEGNPVMACHAPFDPAPLHLSNLASSCFSPVDSAPATLLSFFKGTMIFCTVGPFSWLKMLWLHIFKWLSSSSFKSQTFCLNYISTTASVNPPAVLCFFWFTYPKTKLNVLFVIVSSMRAGPCLLSNY